MIGGWLGRVVRRIHGKIREQSRFALGSKPDCSCKQKDLTGLINKERREAMLARAGVWDKGRLLAASAPHSGSWLDATPNQVLDTHLTNAEVQYGARRRLGVELCEEGPCPLCLGVVDRWGAHCESWSITTRCVTMSIFIPGRLIQPHSSKQVASTDFWD